MPISQAIEESTGRDVLVGSVYAALERLEEKSFVSSASPGDLAIRAAGLRRYPLHKTVPTSPNIARLMSGNDNGPIPMNASWKRCSEYSLPVFAR